MGLIDSDWDRAIHDYSCKKNKERQDEIWSRFLRMYKHKNGKDWKPLI